VESGYKALGLDGEESKLAHVMSDDYRADVTLASVEDARRQSAWENKIKEQRASEGKHAAKMQHQVLA